MFIRYFLPFSFYSIFISLMEASNFDMIQFICLDLGCLYFSLISEESLINPIIQCHKVSLSVLL